MPSDKQALQWDILCEDHHFFLSQVVYTDVALDPYNSLGIGSNPCEILYKWWETMGISEYPAQNDAGVVLTGCLRLDSLRLDIELHRMTMEEC